MTESQFHSFAEGNASDAWTYMGCHSANNGKKKSFVFRVWAPHAESVYIAGSFNNWNPDGIPMNRIGYGIFEAKTNLPKAGDTYKYCIHSGDGRIIWKADPYGRSFARLPDTASIVYEAEPYKWTDGEYRKAKARWKPENAPINIYEVHVGSWKKHEDGSPLSYRELADCLVPYASEMGYTHIELLPVMEHPYEPSWGYQLTGFFAPSSRWGTPEDLKYFVDICHANKIGVIFDWVPGHFPKDEQGLYEFDGQPCYESDDPVMNEHPQWTTRLFDYKRPEVQSFLLSSAMYWLMEFHADGLRVDAVASMLYLDFERTEWHPNRYGTNLNLEAIEFLKKLNKNVSSLHRYLLTAAEESSTFPHVTGPDENGLGFGFKWNMGWMNDVLKYMELDPLYRKFHHNLLTFTMTYAYTERFILPFSHDEVVHGKKSLLDKMPGSYDDKFANLRLLYGFLMTHPGKKLCFMGGEFGQFIEWDEQRPLDWFLLQYERHGQMQHWTHDLNRFYKEHPQLWQNDRNWDGFQWIQPDDADNSVIAYRRIDNRGKELIVILNFCPVVRDRYVMGLPSRGCYIPRLCSDNREYGGTGVNVPVVRAEPNPWHQYNYSGSFTLPPLSAIIYEQE